MKKRIIFTSLGLIFSLIIAIGGWLLTVWLIELRSDALLSSTGITYFDAPPYISRVPQEQMSADVEESTIYESQNYGSEDAYNELPYDELESATYEVLGLSNDEIMSILHTWEFNNFEMPHEPTPEQINMSQAVWAAEAGLLSISQLWALPEEALRDMQFDAFLCQNWQRGQEQFFDAVYSYWHVSLRNEFLSAVFMINAVTGQIWGTEINISRPGLIVVQELNEDEFDEPQPIAGFTENDALNLLDEFISNIGLSNFENRVVHPLPSGILIYDIFSQGELFAAINVLGRPLDDETWFLMGLNISLSLSAPDAIFWN